MQTYAVILAAGVVLTSVAFTDGCTCMPTHPQQQFCNADFVILARIKKEYTLNDTRIYKTRIRKEYKMSEKALVALKSGRLITSRYDSVCGVQLQTGKLYAIAGKIYSLKAHVSLCNLVEPWENLSRRQRKGLRSMYRQGCTCGIRRCNSAYYRCVRKKDACNWTTFGTKTDCQRREGICLRSASNQCMWARNAAQTNCMRNNLTNTTQKHTISRWSG